MSDARPLDERIAAAENALLRAPGPTERAHAAANLDALNAQKLARAIDDSDERARAAFVASTGLQPGSDV